MVVWKFILVLMISIPSPIDGARHNRELVLHGPFDHAKCVKVRRYYNRVMRSEEFKRTRCRRIRIILPEVTK